MTSTDLAIADPQAGALALRPGQATWSDAQLDVLKVIGAEHATKAELDLFLHVCQRTGLDPFARQIYLLNYGGKNSKATIQTGIDGFRLIGRRAADRAGHTVELTDTEWCGPDGQWVEVWLSPEPPAAARVAVLRDGKRFPSVALYAELVATKAVWENGRDTGRRVPNDRWGRAPASQLAKCAEALAYRKAFPQDLAGLMIAEEAEHLGNPGPVIAGTLVASQDPPRELVDLLELVEAATTRPELEAVWEQRGALDLEGQASLRTALRERAAHLERPADDTEGE